jgi:hypothetical protein
MPLIADASQNMAILLNIRRSARSSDMCDNMVPARGPASDTETPRHRRGRASTCPRELGVDRSPVPIWPIVASDGDGGRLGNYADPTAREVSWPTCTSRWATTATAASAAVPLARHTTPGCAHRREPHLACGLWEAGAGDDAIGNRRGRISGYRKLRCLHTSCANQRPLSRLF